MYFFFSMPSDLFFGENLVNYYRLTFFLKTKQFFEVFIHDFALFELLNFD